MVEIMRLLSRNAGKIWSMKHKQKRRKNLSGQSEYEVRIPKSVSRKLQRKKKF